MKLFHTMVAFVCFAPISFFLLTRILMSPGYVMMLGMRPGGPRTWDFIWPVLLVGSGIVGLVGICRVTTGIWRAGNQTRGRWVTIVMIVVGAVSLASFNVAFSERPVGALAYGILPVIGTAYLLYVARGWLFRLDHR